MTPLAAAPTLASSRKLPEPLEHGRDELNLATYPLGALLQQCPVETEQKQNRKGEVREILYHKRVSVPRWDPGAKKKVTASIQVTTSSSDGFPTQEDEEILLTLLCHAVSTGQLTSLKVKFNREDVLSMLSHTKAGTSYAQVETALDRYHNARFEFLDAWYDTESGEFLKSFSLRFIAELGIQRKRRGQHSPTCFLTWAPSFHKILQSQNLKLLKLNEMLRLPKGATRYAYRFLDKRSNRGRIPIDLAAEDFARHCGLSLSQNPRKLRQTLRRILDALKREGLITDGTLERGTGRGARVHWRVRVTMGRRREPFSEGNDGETMLDRTQTVTPESLLQLFYQSWLKTHLSALSARERALTAKLLSDHGEQQAKRIVKGLTQVLSRKWPECKTFTGATQYLPDVLKALGVRRVRATTDDPRSRAERLWESWPAKEREELWNQIRSDFPDAEYADRDVGLRTEQCLRAMTRNLSENP